MKQLIDASAEQLDQVEGGAIYCPYLGYVLYQKMISDGGGAEPLPGFNKFLAETQRIAGKA